MNTPAKLLARLDQIGAALAASGKALALIGLGSVGVERDRLDAYSDLDFFAIVRDSFKQDFITDLGWLNDAHPLIFSFQNTADGHKALFADGIFCEFAVFEVSELQRIPYAPGRFVWKAEGVSDELLTSPLPPPQPHTADWLVGELLTNLYVGLSRLARGEVLAAFRLIQVYAVDRALELAALTEPAAPVPADVYAVERRFESRFPTLSPDLPALMPGYADSRAAARALLAFAERYTPLNPAMKSAVLALCDSPQVAE